MADPQFQYVKLPDGSYGKFDAAASDDEIQGHIKQDFPDAFKEQHPILDAVKDFGKGVLKSGIGTMSAADDFAQKHLPAFMTTPIGQAPTAENSARAVETAKQMATPNGTAQAIGKGIGNAAQFLIPGAAEEAGASMLAPTIGKVASKLATSALGAGVVNKAQGGGFGAGAVAGGIGSGIGQVAQKVAPVLAETALKVRGADRGYGATPGRAILDETTGIKPSSVVDSARKSLGDLNNEASNIASKVTEPVDLGATRTGALDAQNTAFARNNKGTIKDLSELNDQLGKEYATGAPIPKEVPATRAVELKRGLGDLRNFNPTVRSDFGDAAVGNAYHTLGQSINEVAPEIAPLNQRMQSLIPVVKRAEAADLNAGPLQRAMGRFGAHSGALTIGGLGAGAGYEKGGTPGAIAGGLAGLAGTELLASPETSLALARIFNSPKTLKAIPAGVGLGLQLNR